ncbi:MAG: pyruvate kinase [Chloroflexi bacterium]|nr:pyruvate kinase [Chloroflexota bacterium]
MDRKAKIVATMGPSSDPEPVLRRLIVAGMDVARLNFSHGSHEEHGQRIALLRKLSDEYKKPIAILQDLQGPKLRVGNLPADGVALQRDEEIVLTSDTAPQTANAHADLIVIPMEVPDLVNSISPGKHILLDDGQLEFEVTEVGSDFIRARVVLGGVLKSHKGVNLPGVNLNIPSLTEKDEEDLAFGLQQGVDLIAISFVRSPQDVLHVREKIFKLSPNQADIPIIAKLEKPEAIENLEEILDVTDGVMVARGDLAVETSPSQVPIIQKKIIEAANRKARVVITATQMLNSMIYDPRPTRAEASDVANAIFDGTDAVMLSGETAMGEYPVESVSTMDQIVCEAEKHLSDWGHCNDLPKDATSDDAISLTRAARELAHDRNVSAIAVFTQTGHTALLMSKARPQVPIMAFTPERATYQRLGLFRGVIPFLVPFASTVELMLLHVENAMIASGEIHPGDQVVLLSGFPVGAMRPPNFTLLYTVGEPI